MSLLPLIPGLLITAAVIVMAAYLAWPEHELEIPLYLPTDTDSGDWDDLDCPPLPVAADPIDAQFDTLMRALYSGDREVVARG